MPNHVHLVLVPQSHGGLATCMSQVHRRYARHVNEREGWRGHLWQERFYSTAMDDRHAYLAARYIMMNPVRARLAPDPSEWRHSSMKVHLGENERSVVDRDAFRDFSIDWQELIAGNEDVEATDLLRRRTRTGRPTGSEQFIARVERETGLDLSIGRAGRKKTAIG